MLVAVNAVPIAGVSHDPAVTNPTGIRYTADGSHEFNDMQMYVATLFERTLMPGAPIDLPCPSVTLFPALQRPRARSSVTLRSADPDVPPLIDLNYLADLEDLRRMVDGVASPGPS